MAQLIFKRGSLANLNNLAITDGQFIVTTDEGALYVDNGSTRVRLGDFIVVENVAALPTDGANRKAMYYCESENVLARWNGTDWTQINKQPTTAELKVKLGLDAEGEVTAAIAAAKKAGDDAQTAVDNLTTYVGAIPNDENGQPMAASVVAYINKKTDGIATSGNLEALGNRVTTVEGKVATIEGDYLKGDDKTELEGKITTAQTAADNAQTYAEGVAGNLTTHANDTTKHITAEERTAWNAKTTMAEVEGKGYLVADDIADKADKTQVATDIADAVKAEADLRVAADEAIEAKIGTVEEGTTVVKMIEDAQAADATARTELKTELQGNIDKKVAQDAYDLKVAALESEDTRLSGLITDMDTAYKAADTELGGRIAALEADITGLSGAMHFKGVVEELPATTEGYANGDTIIVGNKEYVVNGEAFVELGDVSAEVQRISDLEGVVGKAAEGENAATGLVKATADNAAAIAAEKARAEAKEADLAAADATNLQAAKDYADAAVEGLGIGDYVKKADADNTYAVIGHNHDDKYDAKGAAAKALEDAQAYADQAEADALSAAKTYADGLNTAMDTRVDALEAIDHEAYKGYADQAELDAIAAAKTETEAQVKAEKEAREAAEADLAAAIEAAKTDASNKDAVVLSEAQKYADQAEADAIAAAEGKVNTLAGNVYTKAQTYTQDEVDGLLASALTWSEF